MTSHAERRPTGGRQIGGYRLAEGMHTRGSNLPWHYHDGPTICFVRQGGFVEGFRGLSLTCEPAMVKFTPAGEPHFNRFEWTDTRGLLVELAADFAAELRRLAPVLDERVHFQGGVVAALAYRIHRELNRGDSAAPLAIEGLLLELIAEANRARPPATKGEVPGFLLRARDLLHDRLSEGIGLSELAQAVDVHPVTLSRAFRRAFGCAVGEYLRRARLDRATAMLAATDLPLARIALDAGFHDQSHFSNHFRRRTGLSPSHYRRVLRQ
ncbi:MAG TPA: AraC family transcriptional regulator [Gemmatimonadales bacterium]|nr:AraC family transcriptional regulator [Gemmatimonadales bacterium]